MAPVNQTWTLWGWFLYLHALPRQSHLPEEASVQSQLYPLGRACCNPHYHRLCNRGNQQYKLFRFTYFLWQPNSGPCGAGSCIFMPYQDNPICLKKPVSSHSSNLLGELVAIFITIDYVTEEINNTNFSDLHIFSDSQSAIGILKLGWQPTLYKHTVAEIKQKIQRLEQKNITVNISWTPGSAMKKWTSWLKRHPVRQQQGKATQM